MNDSPPVSVLAGVRAEHSGAGCAVSPGGYARWRPLLLIIAVVVGLLGMHTSPVVPVAAAHLPAAVQGAAQAGPAEPDGPGGCPCATGCSDMSACQALTVSSWAPAQPPTSAPVDLPLGDVPAVGDGRGMGRAPTRPPIGLRVTAVTVTRI